MDPKVFVGGLLTAGSMALSQIEKANEIAQLVLTSAGVIVAILTALYTAMKIRKLLEDQDGDD